MRSLTDIKAGLIAALETQESGAWSQISQSLVGKELIAFGAEVIAASDSVVDSLINSFDYNLADERALISLSHVLNVPISFNKPAYIRIRLNNKAGLSFKPFDLTYSIGNVKFTNISYFNGNDDIILYQGIVKTMKTGSDIIEFNYEKTVDWNSTVIPVDTDSFIKGHNIGNAYPDSVYMFYLDETSQGNMSAYSPMRSGPEVACYKQYTLMNRNIVVLDGDGVWGKVDYRSPQFQILWLEPTENNFALNGNLVSKVHGKLNFRVMGSANAQFNSLAFAREVFRKYYLEMNAIVSKEQIKDYVNSFAYVNDCSVFANNNIIYVYIKPKDPTDRGEYGNIQSVLDTKGGILTTHEVAKGSALNFQFKIESQVKMSMKSQIETYLKDTYGYDNVAFDEIVNCVEVATNLYSRFGVSVRVVFGVENAVVDSGNKLQFIPISGSIKIINSDNKVIGYDLNGQLFMETTSENGIYHTPLGLNSRLGKVTVNNGLVSGLFGFDRGYIRQYPSNAVSRLFGANKFGACTHNGYVYAYENDEIGSSFCIYDLEQLSPQAFISNIIPISGSVPKTMRVLDERVAIPIYLNGAYYCLVKVGTELQLQFYTGTGYSSYYTLSIPQVSHDILGIYISGTTIYVVCEGGNVIVISHFNTVNVGWSNVKLEIPEEVKGKSILGFHCYKDGYCSILFGTNETGSEEVKDISVCRCSSLSLTDSSVKLMNFAVIHDSELELSVGEIYVYGTDEYVWYGNLRSSVSELVYDDSEVYPQDLNARVYPIYQLTASAIVGTVNYMDGTIVYEGTSGTSFSYDSSMVSLDERTYLQLDETTPVIWN